jgi:hypothetical protein
MPKMILLNHNKQNDYKQNDSATTEVRTSIPNIL